VLRWLALGALLARAAVCFPQDTGTVHEAPYIPTPPATVQEMLRLAAVGPADVVYDLGSGDGRVVIAAARDFGARAVGIEREAKLVTLSREAASRAGVADRTRFLQQDIFATSLAEASVVAIYLSPNLNLKLRPALLGLKPGTRVVSHGSDMGDWMPDRATAIRKDVRLWVVPAQVAGRWRSALGARPLELELKQRYQAVSADARLAGAATQVWESRLSGDTLSFVIVDAVGSAEEKALYFEGKVSGGRIEGSVARGAGKTREVQPWRAERQ
jgi:SAM-dependent methyltransferase